MKFDITIEHLVMLVAVLYIASFIMQTKEAFDSLVEKNDTTNTKECGQKSVNYNILDYIFTSPSVPRR